jgi:hypothetical protein
MPIMRPDSSMADEVARSLAEVYQISLAKDWGEQVLEGPEAAWRGGEWSLEELHILQQAVTDLARAMGSPEAFARNLGAIQISQEDIKYRGLATSRGVRFTSSPVSIDQWTVVHELAHVWDAHHDWRLSKGLERYTGAFTNRVAMWVKRWRSGFDPERRLPGCNRFGYYYRDIPPAGSDANFNRKEDFAESMAAYVYPALAQARVDRWKDDERYRHVLYYPDYTQTRRWAFVDGLMRGTIVVQ